MHVALSSPNAQDPQTAAPSPEEEKASSDPSAHTFTTTAKLAASQGVLGRQRRAVSQRKFGQTLPDVVCMVLAPVYS
ncbi:uncharacterized protein BKA78DRAFT_55957 [Phyllosticta capitalensis]|uniref:uncharacterized protein n=1 Tax=Phyllosticta capitalensis TaxID=121624 RepID=UPI00312F1502